MPAERVPTGPSSDLLAWCCKADAALLTNTEFDLLILDLGLPIVEEIARQHRARLMIDDAHPGEEPPGTLFTVAFEASA